MSKSLKIPGRISIWPLIAVLLAGTAVPLMADSRRDSGEFRITVSGIRAGDLTYQATNDGQKFTASASVVSSGLIGQLYRVSYHASSSGRIINGQLVPDQYREITDTGARTSSASLDRKSGAARITSKSPSGPVLSSKSPPAAQRGALDVMTGIYLVLRDVPPENLCSTSHTMFDGQRRSKIVLAPAKKSPGKATCAGEYRRLDGFTAEEMADRTRFPFTLFYEKLGDGWYQVTRFTTRTTFGIASAVRR